MQREQRDGFLLMQLQLDRLAQQRTTAEGETAGEAPLAVPHALPAADSETLPQPTPAAAPTLETPPPPIPRTSSPFETAARETLRKIWNWIIVGEDHIPTGVSTEYAVASQWLLRIGIVVLVIGIGFFLKYSIDRGLLGPQARVGLSAIVGLSMLVLGTQLLGGRYRVLGQGLMGGGLAASYFSVFAAHELFNIIDALPAFALMAAITVLAGGIAVRFNSMLVAVLGIVGGYGTPLMLSSGPVNFPGLFGSMLVLGIGVLAICFWKNWPLVNLLSFFATYGLMLLALQSYNRSHFYEVLPFLIGFFVLFSTMTFLFKVVRRARSNALDLLALLANAGVFFGISFRLIDEAYGRLWVASVSLGLAAFYTTHVFFFLRRRLVDRELLVVFLGLAAFFLAVTMPLVLSREWVTASWAIQALVLLWVAEKLGSGFVRRLSYVLFAVVLARFCLLDLNRHFLSGDLADLPWTDFLKMLGERAISCGVPIASFGIAYRMVDRTANAAAAQNVAELTEGPRLISAENDLRPWLSDAWAMRAITLAGLAMLFFYMHLEVTRTVGHFYAPARLPMLTIVWLGLCGLLLYEYLKRENTLSLMLLAVAAAAVLLKVFLWDLPSWGTNEFLLCGPGYSSVDATMRLLDFTPVIGFLAGAYMLVAGRQSTVRVRAFFGVACLAMLIVYLTLEANSFLHEYAPGLQAGGVSIVWATFAFVLILQGITRNATPLRYAGLALFAIVSAKVFFVDLASLDQFWRIIAFVILGLLLLAGSFVYLKYRETFALPTVRQERP